MDKAHRLIGYVTPQLSASPRRVIVTASAQVLAAQSINAGPVLGADVQQAT